MATTYVNGATGNDTTGNGTEALPWATWQKAMTAGTAGDTVIVEGGIYTGTLAVTKNNFTFTSRNGRAIAYLGTAVPGTWVQHDATRWKKTGVTMNDPSVPPLVTDQILVFRPTATTFAPGRQMDTLAEVTLANFNDGLGVPWFYDRATTTLYIYATSDPTTAYYSVDYTVTHGLAGTESLTYGVIYDTSSGLTLNGIAAYGCWGSGYLGYLCTNPTLNDCEFSFNTEDGAGGHGGTHPVANRCIMSWNGVRRMRQVDGSDILSNGNGWSWHATVSVPGTESTTIEDNYCVYIGNCKNAFENINASTEVSTGAVIRWCCFNLLMNNTGGTHVVKNARITAHPDDLSGCGLITAGATINFIGCTFRGTGDPTKICFVSAVGDVSLLRDCIIDNWGADYFSAGTPGTEDHNCLHVTVGLLTPGTGSITTDPQLKGSDLRIPRTSPCAGTGAATAGLTIDAAGVARPNPPSMGAMEPTTVLPAHGGWLDEGHTIDGHGG